MFLYRPHQILEMSPYLLLNILRYAPYRREIDQNKSPH